MRAERAPQSDAGSGLKMVAPAGAASTVNQTLAPVMFVQVIAPNTGRERVWVV